jgi:hypothetical protein
MFRKIQIRIDGELIVNPSVKETKEKTIEVFFPLSDKIMKKDDISILFVNYVKITNRIPISPFYLIKLEWRVY